MLSVSSLFKKEKKTGFFLFKKEKNPALS